MVSRSNNSRILYVDSDEACCTLVRRLLESAGGNEVTTVSATEEALELLAMEAFDLYIFDQPWRYPVALELCRYVRQKDQRIPILVFSVLPREIDRNKALAAGANGYLIKPDDINRLAETVERLLRKEWYSEVFQPVPAIPLSEKKNNSLEDL